MVFLQWQRTKEQTEAQDPDLYAILLYRQDTDIRTCTSLWNLYSYIIPNFSVITVEMRRTK